MTAKEKFYIGQRVRSSEKALRLGLRKEGVVTRFSEVYPADMCVRYDGLLKGKWWPMDCWAPASEDQ